MRLELERAKDLNLLDAFFKDALLGEGAEMGCPPEPPERGKGGNPNGGPGRPARGVAHENNPMLGSVRYSHDALIDAIVQNPMLNGKQLGAMFGFHPAWVNRITSSDSFKVKLAERKKELIDPIITANAEERLEALMKESTDVLLDKLATTPTADLALEALKVSSKALGYGARQDGGGTQVNFVVALPGKAIDAQSWERNNRHMGAGTAISVPSSQQVELIAKGRGD